jgi:glycosyltransferase involved in cell wall biosynthesis
MSALASIIIPAHDAAPWLGQALESALAQTWPSCEVVVVDDGSADGTLAIAQGYQARGVRVVTQANRGVSAARNAGLALARGEYVQFLDPDDLLAPDKIERQLATLSGLPPDTLCTCRWGRFRADPARAQFGTSPVWRDLAAEDYLAHVAQTGNAVPLHAWLLPRSVVERIGPWVEGLQLMEDHEYFARAVLASSGIRHAGDTHCLYRTYHARSLSRRRDKLATSSMFGAVERIAARLVEAPPSARRRQIAADYYQWLSFALYPERPELVRAAAQRARDLGGSQVRPRMGRRAAALSRIFGWKFVQRLRAWLWSRDIYLGKDDLISD